MKFSKTLQRYLLTIPNLPIHPFWADVLQWAVATQNILDHFLSSLTKKSLSRLKILVHQYNIMSSKGFFRSQIFLPQQPRKRVNRVVEVIEASETAKADEVNEAAGVF